MASLLQSWLSIYRCWAPRTVIQSQGRQAVSLYIPSTTVGRSRFSTVAAPSSTASQSRLSESDPDRAAAHQRTKKLRADDDVHHADRAGTRTARLNRRNELGSSDRSNDAKRKGHASSSGDEPQAPSTSSPKAREPWQVQKEALKKKFGDQKWKPPRRLSPDAMEGIRALHAQYPEQYPTPVLANQFEVSPEVIRRILKSRWRPSEEETAKRAQRWLKRGQKIWTQNAEKGMKPPRKWREMGIGLQEHERRRGFASAKHRPTADERVRDQHVPLAESKRAVDNVPWSHRIL